MINQELLNYVRLARAQGVTDDQIKTNLASGGWSEQDIKDAMSGSVVFKPVEPAHTTPEALTHDPEIAQPKGKGLKIVGTLFLMLIFMPLFGAFGYFGFSWYSKQNFATQKSDTVSNEAPVPIVAETTPVKSPYELCQEKIAQIPVLDASSSWPGDMLFYPGSTMSQANVDASGSVFTSVSFTCDSIDNAKNHFISNTSGWKITEVSDTSKSASEPTLLRGEKGSNRTMIILNSEVSPAKIIQIAEITKTTTPTSKSTTSKTTTSNTNTKTLPAKQ